MRLILCGIVKDESDNVTRTLDSFKPLLYDAAGALAGNVILTDTGSTDGTPEIIEAWLRENGIPGIVYRCPWPEYAKAQGLPPRADGSPALFDFARARNLSVSLAMQHSHDPANAWLCEIDSTWELKGQVHRLRGALESAPADVTGYELTVNQAGASSVPYLRLRRVSECGPGKWLWRARIHEYLWRADNAVTGRIEGVWVDHNDTPQSFANRKKRLERDVEIFDEEIAEMTARGVHERPHSDHERGELTRSYFYRGQALEGLERWDEAYASYEQRAKMQGAVQEWASACYRCGRLAVRQDLPESVAASWYLEAFAVGGRPEGLWAYAELSVRLKRGDIAQAAARIAYDVAKAQKPDAGGFSYPEAYALSTPGPARDHATIAARIKQLGLLGVPYPAGEE